MRRAGQAFGFAAILFLVNYYILIFSSGDALLHSAIPLTNIAGANLLDIAAATLLFACLTSALRRTSQWPLWRFVLAAILPVLLFFRNAALLPWPPRPRSIFLSLWPDLAAWPWPPRPEVIGLLTLVWLSLLLLLAFRLKRGYRLVLRLGGIVLAGFGLFAAMVCWQLVRIAAWRPGPAAFTAPSAVASSLHSRARIVWIVFDELSYDQTFGRRAPDLALPSFDAVRAESTLYTDVHPAGFATSTVLPSLFLGRIVKEARYAPATGFQVKTPDNPNWVAFDGRGTIFSDARARGWSTAVVGWWNPYCTVLKEVLNSCYWSNWDAFDVPMSPRSGMLHNAVTPFRFLLQGILSPADVSRRAEEFAAREHRVSYEDLYVRSTSLLRDPSPDFIFLHLPVPHPPNLYDRRTGQFAEARRNSYLDNLALADRTLGDLLRILRASPRWPETTLLINGDHSWRIPLWRGQAGWTAEDERASRGVFDTRPVLLVHAPGQSTPATVVRSFPLLGVHGLLSGILETPREEPVTLVNRAPPASRRERVHRR